MRKLTVSRVRNDANEARIPHTDSHTHPREARPRAPRRLAGPVRGEQHRGARGSELWSIDLQLVVINPMVLFHFSTSPLGQSPLCQRRTDPAIPRPNPSARLAKEMSKSRGINYVGGVQGTWGQLFFVKSPTDRPHRRRGPRHRRRKQNKKTSHGTKAYSSAKGRFFPLHASPRRRLSPCGNRIVGATRERPEEGTKSLVGGALGAPAILQQQHGTGRHRSAFGRASLARWGIGPDGARLVTAGLEAAGVCLLVYAEGSLSGGWRGLGGSSYLLISFSCCCDDG